MYSLKPLEGALFAAVRMQNLENLREIIDQEPQTVQAREQDGRTPLIEAAGLSNAAIVKALLDAGANPNAKEHTLGDTPLHAAVKSDNQENTLLLLDSGANQRETNFHGYTPLDAAILNTNQTLVELLKSKASEHHTENPNDPQKVPGPLNGSNWQRKRETATLPFTTRDLQEAAAQSGVWIDSGQAETMMKSLAAIVARAKSSSTGK